MRADYVHLSSILSSAGLHRQLGISCTESIYTTEIGKCYTAGLPPCFPALITGCQTFTGTPLNGREPPQKSYGSGAWQILKGIEEMTAGKTLGRSSCVVCQAQQKDRPPGLSKGGSSCSEGLRTSQEGNNVHFPIIFLSPFSVWLLLSHRDTEIKQNPFCW